MVLPGCTDMSELSLLYLQQAVQGGGTGGKHFAEEVATTVWIPESRRGYESMREMLRMYEWECF